MPRQNHLGILALLSALLLPIAVYARPAHKKALVDFFGPALPKNLHNCRICHLPDQPGADDGDKPHNAFGVRLAKLRKKFRKAGKSADIVSRLRAVADEDSDGDGAGNFLELLSGHVPGDANDKPTAAELTIARRKLTEFLSRPRDVYAWLPFEPVKRPPLPKVKRDGWQSNPIDAFIAAEHERHGLQPRPEAAKPTLLRRVYLDLIGLPPTADELHVFLADASPNAYEKVVDRLLASPHYGERWGRHWMDVWRYADWSGYGAEVRDSQPHIWHWRDWIVESLNADKGYDRMVQEMLAADELAPGDADAVRATGFLVRNWYRFNRNVWLERTVEHTGKAFLGITLNCARCHDHMFDPFAQKEFYSFRAFFEPEQIRTDRIAGVADTKKDGIPRIYDANAATPTYLFTRGDERHPDKSKPIAPAVPAALGGSINIQPVKLPSSQIWPDRRDFATEETIAASKAANDKARQAVARARCNALVAAASVASNTPLSLAATTPVLHCALESLTLAERNESIVRAEYVGLKYALEVLHVENRKTPTFPATSTGRRLALARWITDKNNPLAARVAVNHIWLRHFGNGIVPSEFDFGRNGRPPSHPALLDWLADEFMAHGWSMKHMHRLIVTSRAYRMDSRPNPTNAIRDRDNRFLWRMNPRRVEGEVVRDSLLYVSGQLDTTMGGPDIDHRLGLKSRRRSLYFRHAAEKEMEFLALFDAASVNECYRRNESIVPQQALALANSPLALTQARLLAHSLSQKIAMNDATAFVNAGFETVLSRPPTEQESTACLKFLGDQTMLLAGGKKLTASVGVPASPVRPAAEPAQRARENLIHVLMNHNDFVTVR